ncbi:MULTISPECIES: VOC family protein [Halorussus]|uniref:VOC family protein n=1 Tax=Halorussus TaxID=1070314 RepID=UPI00209F737D|nr:VOC family protein [Halorussus vallis]USZ74906.1 VOC family protein [Halorussus vallis]
MSSPKRPSVGHVHAAVSDADRSVEFYAAVLGLDVRERYDGYAALTWGSRHHDVVLQEDAEATPCRIAVEVPDADALVTIYRACGERGVEAAPVDHGISKALYFPDPDGNELEVYLDARDSDDGLGTYLDALVGGDEPPFEARTESFDPDSLAG